MRGYEHETNREIADLGFLNPRAPPRDDEAMVRTREQVYDELLVIQAQSGEADALGELISRWHQHLTRYARRLVDDATAADAVQDACIAIARSVRRLEDPALFGPWARRIVANKCADAARQRARQRKLTASREHAGPPVETRDEQARLRLALDRLPIDRRALLVMRYMRDMSTAAIASVLRVPEGTVKSRLHHARNELQSILERSM